MSEPKNRSPNPSAPVKRAKVWPTRTITSWEEFVGIVAEYLRANIPEEATNISRPTYSWRGQANVSWSLKPSLHRIFSDNTTVQTALTIEQDLLRIFKVRSNLYVDSNSIPPHDDLFSWWTLMQHFGAPTRLLDWTDSPYAAAYFAIESHWDKDGVVFMAATYRIGNHMKAKMDELAPDTNILRLMGEVNAPSILIPWHPARMNKREVAQQGRYVFNMRVLEPIDDAIFDLLNDPSLPNPKAEMLRVVIPARLKPEFLIHLRSMNVFAGSLFPDIEGLGKTLKELALLAVAVDDRRIKPELPERMRSETD